MEDLVHTGDDLPSVDELQAEWQARRNGSAPTTAPEDYRFSTFKEFLAHEYPKPEPLLGVKGASYLAVGMLLLLYGDGGSAKSTLTIDGLCHLATGMDWLGIEVPRPVRCLLVENEGPGGLFQEKLEHKKEVWDGDDFDGNLHVYAEPWGKFSFADPSARQALTDHCDKHKIELVAANPTLGLGVGASGKPDETQEFVNWLKGCGLYSGRAFWVLHHPNKSGKVSGDWERLPDTLIRLMRDGNRQRSKLTWEKTRWATLDREQYAVMLDWVPETEGYEVKPLDTVGASDELLVQRLVEYLEEHPFTRTGQVLKSVEGTDARLKNLLETRPEFDCTAGPNNSKLWSVAAREPQEPQRRND
jgi:hypothetical protein